MKRFFWIEIMILFTNYILMINHLELLSVIGFILSLFILKLMVSKLNYHCFALIFAITLVLSNELAIHGGLNVVYAYCDLIMVLISLHLSLLYEILCHQKNLRDAIRPYCVILLISISFFMIGFYLKDSISFNDLYPYGFLSLISLIGLMFIPYLSIMTLSFLVHEYN